MIKLYKKHKEIIDYIFFGVVTTVVSMLAYKLVTIALLPVMHNDEGEASYLLVTIATAVQWVSGVAVAFVTNKIFVFKDKYNDFKSVMRQLGIFAGSRVVTGLIDWGISVGGTALFYNLGWFTGKLIENDTGFFARMMNKLFTADFIAKCIAAVIVIISNYFISKFFVFTKKKTVQPEDKNENKTESRDKD